MANYRNKDLLRIAATSPCQNCGRDDGSIVAAHPNMTIYGKGFGIKAHDCFVAYLCHACHDWYDGRAKAPMDPHGSFKWEEKSQMFRRAMDRTWLWLWRNNYIEVKK